MLLFRTGSILQYGTVTIMVMVESSVCLDDVRSGSERNLESFKVSLWRHIEHDIAKFVNPRAKKRQQMRRSIAKPFWACSSLRCTDNAVFNLDHGEPNQRVRKEEEEGGQVQGTDQDE
jgi:hypothetical protein